MTEQRLTWLITGIFGVAAVVFGAICMVSLNERDSACERAGNKFRCDHYNCHCYSPDGRRLDL